MLTKARAAARTHTVRRCRRSKVTPNPRTPRANSQGHGPRLVGGTTGVDPAAVVVAVTVTVCGGPLRVSEGCEIEQPPAGIEAEHLSVIVWLKPPVGVNVTE